MKSTDVYREARQILAPWCKNNGFKRTSGGMLGWFRQENSKYVTFWLQCSQDGWDTYAGSKFIAEFQYSSHHIGGYGVDGIHHRLPYFLAPEDLNLVQKLQNGVIAKLELPPPDYYIFGTRENAVKRYMNKFMPIIVPYTKSDDIWFRYKDADDVRCWAEFVLSVLPGAVNTLVSTPN